MTAAHVEQVAQLEKCCFSDPWSVQSIGSERENSLSTWLVAVENGAVVGYVGAQSVIDAADMMNLAVSPIHRRRGIAGRLVENLIDALRCRNVSSLMLEVRASNQPAIALYRKLGFCQVGRRKNYYRAPKEDAIMMRKEWNV